MLAESQNGDPPEKLLQRPLRQSESLTHGAQMAPGSAPVVPVEPVVAVVVPVVTPQLVGAATQWLVAVLHQ